jgi:hypothetical protein
MDLLEFGWREADIAHIRSNIQIFVAADGKLVKVKQKNDNI